MKKYIIIFFVILGGAGAYRFYQISTTKPTLSIEKQQQESGFPARTFVVEPGLLEKTVRVSGSIEPLQTVSIAPTVTERIAALHAETGQQVKQGQKLVSLKADKSKLHLSQAQASVLLARHQLARLVNGTRPEEIEMARARAEEAAAEHNMSQIELERQRNLYAAQAASLQQMQDAESRFNRAAAFLTAAQAQHELLKQGPRQEDIDIGRAQVELAQAALAQAQQNLDDHYLKAPLDGLVTVRQLEAGDVVEVNQVIFQVIQVDPVYLVLNISELYIPRIRIGQTVKVTVDALGEQTFAGTIERINPIANAEDRSYLCKILIANSAGVLRPGMFARAEIVIERVTAALSVPSDAVRGAGEQKYVLRVDENLIAQRRDVTIAGTYQNRVHVIAGLEVGDRIITLTQTSVQAGAKIKLEENKTDKELNLTRPKLKPNLFTSP